MNTNRPFLSHCNRLRFAQWCTLPLPTTTGSLMVVKLLPSLSSSRSSSRTPDDCFLTSKQAHKLIKKIYNSFKPSTLQFWKDSLQSTIARPVSFWINELDTMNNIWNAWFMVVLLCWEFAIPLTPCQLFGRLISLTSYILRTELKQRALMPLACYELCYITCLTVIVLQVSYIPAQPSPLHL